MSSTEVDTSQETHPSSSDNQQAKDNEATATDSEMTPVDNGKASETMDNQSSSSPKVAKKAAPKTDLRGLPTRQYLDQAVVPILLEALAALSRERPSDPIEYLISYLEKHKTEHQ